MPTSYYPRRSWKPGDRPRTRSMQAMFVAIGVGHAMTKNQDAGLPLFKRPQLHIVWMMGGLTMAYLLTRLMDYKYFLVRRRMLYDTQRQYPVWAFGTVDDIPKRLPDSVTELNPKKPVWYPYTETEDGKKKYFANIGGEDYWQGDMEWMTSTKVP